MVLNFVIIATEYSSRQYIEGLNTHCYNDTNLTSISFFFCSQSCIVNNI